MDTDQAIAYLEKLDCVVQETPLGAWRVTLGDAVLGLAPGDPLSHKLPRDIMCADDYALIRLAERLKALLGLTPLSQLPIPAKRRGWGAAAIDPNHPNCRSTLTPSAGYRPTKPKRDEWVCGDYTLKGLINSVGGVAP